MIDFNWSKGEFFDLDTAKIKEWIFNSLKNEGFEMGETTVVFCSDAELLDMNIKYLAHDYFTDIITFDYSDKNIVSGDLFISVDRVKENAVDLHSFFEVEMNRVIIHGFLHLCGYADKTKEEAELMRRKEDFYLNKLKGFT